MKRNLLFGQCQEAARRERPSSSRPHPQHGPTRLPEPQEYAGFGATILLTFGAQVAPRDLRVRGSAVFACWT